MRQILGPFAAKVNAHKASPAPVSYITDIWQSWHGISKPTVELPIARRPRPITDRLPPKVGKTVLRRVVLRRCPVARAPLLSKAMQQGDADPRLLLLRSSVPGLLNVNSVQAKCTPILRLHEQLSRRQLLRVAIPLSGYKFCSPQTRAVVENVVAPQYVLNVSNRCLPKSACNPIRPLRSHGSSAAVWIISELSSARGPRPSKCSLHGALIRSCDLIK